MRRVHFISGIIITTFIALHLFNHAWSNLGENEHIQLMNTLRLFYRNIFIETILMSAVGLQIVTGIKLFFKARKTATTLTAKMQLWSGIYLAMFFIMHLSAVLIGRHFLHLDTNFYFGAAGLNTFPINLFFIPYYALAMMAFFGHISAIHYKKMKYNFLGLSPSIQSNLILLFGVCLTISIFYGLTNKFSGVKIPSAYHILIGK